MIFHDYTLMYDGMILSHRVQTSDKILPAAIDVFSQLIESPKYRGPVLPGIPNISLQWDTFPGGANATFLSGDQILTASALAVSDIAASVALLKKVVEAFGNTLPTLHLEYPVILSLVFPVPRSYGSDLQMVADMESCVAAAYFLKCDRLGLV